ncbi:hypothetical protein PROVRETT_09483 [Providencia rettgeri DSM 1131]|uniref:autotransporter domain-containing protein n=1 Tax=Providencia rettgeri TaxID=587 RepID=UPI000197C719|nr:autotransporter domain-containing protein [Providencia rettgeri]EFE51755.1 hypothetical protein PROVRETT_09483 [Providencia rettgeri DSM 1131]QXA58872.1 autotransporter domain-containing protein [Providencia rettgeri]
MTGLGTLRADNSGVSNAYGVSADGSVVIGQASSDYGASHAMVWKVKPPVPPIEPPIDPVDPPMEPPIIPPIKPPVVTIVDATNSSQAMGDTGRRGFSVLGLYQNSLNALSQSRCQLGQSDYCVGVFSQYDTLSSNQRVATGLFGTVRLSVETWTLGGAINFANGTNLVDNYDIRGSDHPGVGVFTRYQQNRDDTGLNAELSEAFLQQGLTITRDILPNTEAGEGHSTIKGAQVSLNVQYGVAASPITLVSPEITLVHHKLTRDGYTETRNAEFAATYGDIGQTRTELQLGAHLLSEMLQLDGNVGVTIKLSSE